jgi:lipoprotein NlpD
MKFLIRCIDRGPQATSPSTPGAKSRPMPALALAGLLVVALAGCATSGQRAPVEDRRGGMRPVPSAPLPAGGVAAPPAAGEAAAGSATPAPAPAVEAAPLPPGAENAGKPGYYTVKPGDTLIRIGLETGQNWRDLARWNSLVNPNVLEVGQVVRVAPPAPEVVARPVAPNAPNEARPLPAGSAPAAAGAPSVTASGTAPVASAGPGPAPAGAASAPSSGAAAAPVSPPAAGTAPTPESDEAVGWAWPSAGALLAGFDEVRNKGLTLGGKPGDPVLAAADGRVVYAGSGLRGYGNLVIVKHNNLFLSAYAHNQTLLVKEDQVVRRGQKIAEMGNSEADRVQLHFEIRRQGRPIDPARLLPPR